MASRNRRSESSDESNSSVFPSLSLRFFSIHLRTDAFPSEPWLYTEAMVGPSRERLDVLNIITKAMQDRRNGLEYTQAEASVTGIRTMQIGAIARAGHEV